MSIETKKAVLAHLMTDSKFSVNEVTRLISSFDRPAAVESDHVPTDHRHPREGGE